MKYKYVKFLNSKSSKSFYGNLLEFFELMKRVALLKRIIATNDHAGIDIFIDGNLKY